LDFGRFLLYPSLDVFVEGWLVNVLVVLFGSAWLKPQR
jgi:hypothetical protein